MNKIISLAMLGLAMLSVPGSVSAQEEREINLPPVGKDNDLTRYSDNQTGFWMAAQAEAGYSLFLNKANRPYTEINVTGGYRFNEFLRVGVGFGGRYYIDGHRIRHDRHDWSIPLFFNVRGNIIPGGYRDVVPYYSVDLGGAIRDGFLWRPTIGIRVGQPRSAFLAGLTYTGQTLKYVNGKNRYASFLGITLGYEY